MVRGRSRSSGQSDTQRAVTTQRFFVGSYTRPLPHAPEAQGRGIYGLELDLKTGQLSPAHLLAELTQPSFLAAHPRLPVLYAVSEAQQGQLSAERVQPGGALRQLSQRSTQGDAPVHVSVDALGRWALTVNYAGGVSVVAYPLGESGQLEPCAASAQHHGHGPNLQRQTGPHPHSVTPSPDARHAYVADLGTDEVVGYDLAPGSLLTRLGRLRLPPGSGPRHLAFHPAGELAFLTLELSSSLAALRREPASGRLNLLGLYPARPVNAAGQASPAEVLVSACGQFVYISNRGQSNQGQAAALSSLSVFGVGSHGAELSLLQHLLLPGRTPRSCALSPDGAWLLVANQDSLSITVLSRDAASGQLRLHRNGGLPDAHQPLLSASSFPGVSMTEHPASAPTSLSAPAVRRVQQQLAEVRRAEADVREVLEVGNLAAARRQAAELARQAAALTQALDSWPPLAACGPSKAAARSAAAPSASTTAAVWTARPSGCARPAATRCQCPKLGFMPAWSELTRRRRGPTSSPTRCCPRRRAFWR